MEQSTQASQIENTAEAPAPEQVPATLAAEPKRKSRFVDPSKFERIELGDGDWVEIPARLAYEFVENFQFMDNVNDRINGVLIHAIKNWNLVDANGEPAEITIENIKMLDTTDIFKIFVAVNEKVDSQLSVPKAEKPQSNVL